MNLNVGLLLACVASVFVQFRSHAETFPTQARLLVVVIAMINLTLMLNDFDEE